MPAGRYIARRAGVALLTVFVAASLNFALFRLAPGDPAAQLSRVPGGGEQLRAELTREFGLDRSTGEQYLLYLKGLATGNLGVSFQNREPVVDNISRAMGNTIPMVLLGTILAVFAGCLIGVIAGWRHGSKADHGGVAASMLLYSLPPQWVGLMLVALVGGALPYGGIENNFVTNPGFFDQLQSRATHLILPTITFALALFGQFALVMRSSMVETLTEDYVRTARAKGLTERAVVWRHALQNAALPTLHLTAISLGYVVGGAVLIEVVFSWPGVGLSTYDAVSARDYPMLQGLFLVLVVAVVAANFIADLLTLRMDPRVRRA